MRYFGGKSGKVYEGGIDDWKAAGMTVSTKPTKLAPVALNLRRSRTWSCGPMRWWGNSPT